MEYLSISLNHLQFPSSHQHFSLCIFFVLAILEGMKWYLIKVLTYSFLIACGIEYLFVVCWPFVYLLLRNIYSSPLFKIGLFIIWLLSCKILYIHTHMYIYIYSHIYIYIHTHVYTHIYSCYQSLIIYVIFKIFSHSVGCLLSFLLVSFFRIWSSLTYLFFFLSLTLLVSCLRNQCLT